MSGDLVVTVIPNWNLKADLGECLESLQQVSYAPHQIVVVDNGSIDGSPEYVAKQFPAVKVIALPENEGYAAALNVGIDYAFRQQANYVLALNNDTIVSPQALTQLVAVLDSDPTIGIATPKILYHDHPERLYVLGVRVYPWLPVPVTLGQRWRNRACYTGIMDFDYVSGCAMLIRTRLFHEVGLFDTTYFMYYEDADFCRRLRERRYRVVCAGDAVIYHKASLSAANEKILIRRIRARNRVRFYRRFRHGPHPWLTYLVLAAAAVWRSAEDVMLGQSHLLKPYWQGLWEGWREGSRPGSR